MIIIQYYFYCYALFFITLLFTSFINVENALPKDIYQEMIYLDNWTLLSRK